MDYDFPLFENIFSNLHNMEVRERYFFNVVKNKRDPKYKRGLLTRSLAVCGSVQLLYIFEDIIIFYLNQFCELPVGNEPEHLYQTKLILA